MKSEKGFTLIEILVGLALFAIIGGGIFSSLMLSTKISMNVDSYDAARNLAQSQMEYVQGLSYNENSYSPSSEIDAQYPGLFTDILPPEPVTGAPRLQTIAIEVHQSSNITHDLLFALEGRKYSP